MSVLTAAQAAGIRLLGVKPTTLFSTSTNLFASELAELATETATAIAKAYDWQALTKLKTTPGNGVAIAFPLPDDYDRMPKKVKLHSASFKMAMFRPVRDLDEWIYLQDLALSARPGSWIILGGQLQIFPVMPIGETVRYYYQSNQVVAVGAGAPGSKVAFTADADVFVLSERLLTLGLIWRWRSQKRLEYSEDMTNYEIALSEEISRDRGSKILTVGAQRSPSGVDFAFPGTIVP